MTAGWLAQTCPARSTRAERAPHGPCPSEACPRTDAAPSLQTGELTWLWVTLFGHSHRRPQGLDPQGTLEGALLSGPAKKPSPRKLQTRRHILPSGDSLHCRHTRGDGHASDLRTAKQCLLDTSLRTKGKSRATSSGSAPAWTHGAGAALGLPSTCNTLGRELYASDPSQLGLGLSGHSWRSTWWHSVHPTYLCSFLSYSSEKKSGKHKGTIHCPSMYSQVSAWCLAHRACPINAS